MVVITVMRKPPDGRVVGNVQEYGVGGINIDATRICAVQGDIPGRTPNLASGSHAGYHRPGASMFVQKAGYVPPTSGRWPANLILQHSAGCKCVGTIRIKPAGCTPHLKKSDDKGGQFGWVGNVSNGFLESDGKEPVSNWACIEGCPVGGLNNQTGLLRNGGRNDNKDIRGHGVAGWSTGAATVFSGDSGPASRFFKQVRA